MNARVAGFEVDALFEAERVAVELDSWQFHRGHRSFENDRERDAALLAAQIITIRITWERLIKHPDREAARLHNILESRRLSGERRLQSRAGHSRPELQHQPDPRRIQQQRRLRTGSPRRPPGRPACRARRSR